MLGYENLAIRKETKMICLNCGHMENMDYLHGYGECAILEGETVALDSECICPKEIYDDIEALLRANGKGRVCSA